MPFVLLLQAIFTTLAFSAPGVLLAASIDLPWYLVFCMLFVSSAIGLLPAYFFSHRRLLFALIGAVLVGGASFLLLGFGLFKLLLCLLCVICQIVSVRNYYGEGAQIVHPNLIVAGITMFFASAIIAFFETMDTGPITGICCFLFIVLTVILLNYSAIKQVAGRQARVMLGGNMLLSFLLLGVVTLAIFAKPLKDLITLGLRSLLLFLLQPGEEAMDLSAMDGQQNTGLDMSMFGEASRAPQWLQIAMDILLGILTVVVLLAFIALCCFLLYRLFKGLFALLRAFFKSFQFENGEQGFSDENEQLLSFENMGKQLRRDIASRFKRMFTRPVPWDKLSPRQKMRRLYEQALLRVAVYTPGAASMTPEQFARHAKLPEGFEEDYNIARYSPHEISGQTAENYRKRI